MREREAPDIYSYAKAYDALRQRIKKLSTSDAETITNYCKYISVYWSNLKFSRRFKLVNDMVILKNKGIITADFKDISKEDVISYAYNLNNTLTRDGIPYSHWTIHSYNMSLRKFMGWKTFGEK